MAAGHSMAIAKICCARASPLGLWVLILRGLCMQQERKKQNNTPPLKTVCLIYFYGFLYLLVVLCGSSPIKNALKASGSGRKRRRNKHFGLFSVCPTLKSFRPKTTHSHAPSHICMAGAHTAKNKIYVYLNQKLIEKLFYKINTKLQNNSGIS